MRRTLALGSLLVVAVAPAGCDINDSPGGGEALGAAPIERFLRTEFEGVDIGGVGCFRAVQHGDATTFACSVMVRGAEVEVHVERVEGRRRERFTRREAILDVATIEAFVQQQFDTQLGLAMTVECSPAAVVAAKPGAVFECSAVDAGGTVRSVPVKVEDLDGTVTADLA
jgi:Domain of unknown function (DUF4333)